MSRKKVIIGVNGKTGEISVEADGFKDDTCFAATKAFEDALGVSVKVDKKPEAQKRGRIVKKSKAIVMSGYCG